MEVKKTVKKEVSVITDIICDCCGNTCKSSVDFEYMNLEADWGYGSEKDMERWSAHICEKCVDEKLSFIKFKKENIDFQTVLGTDSDLEKKLDNHLLKYDFRDEKTDVEDDTSTDNLNDK